MRYKITLEIAPEVYGTVLPISYQYELTKSVDNLLRADEDRLSKWLRANGFTVEESLQLNLYCISNLYVPKIYVHGDRLQINVPRIQFWISCYPSKLTTEFLTNSLVGKSIVIGDQVSRVLFRITKIEEVTPVIYGNIMKYQSLSPIVVEGMRPNKSVEYLFPQNPYFARFIVDELINRWEFLNKRMYEGDRRYIFNLLAPERRKAVSVHSGEIGYQKVIGYMLKFQLVLDPQLQEIAYVCGIGDKINLGFGYLELIDKSSK